MRSHRMSWITSRSSTSYFVLSLFLTNCVRHRVQTEYVISSERSSYSPTMRAIVALPIRTDTLGQLIVILDSLVVHAPGSPGPEPLPIMQNLRISALLVRIEDAAADSQSAWRAIATSDSISVVDELSLGQRVVVKGVRFLFASTGPFAPSRTWLVLRITGAALAYDPYTLGGRTELRRRISSGVRVFACSDWTIDGQRRAERARQLASAYNATC